MPVVVVVGRCRPHDRERIAVLVRCTRAAERDARATGGAVEGARMVNTEVVAELVADHAQAHRSVDEAVAPR